MIPRIGSRVAAAVATLALAGAGAVAAQVPASASSFTATYLCNVPGAGTETSTINASLTASPNPATSGSKVGFALDVTSISVPASVAINSWNATAVIEGSGAETSAFTATASGGSVPAGQPINNVDMTGSWTPSASGTDKFLIGDITINMDAASYGNVTVSCTPSGSRPTAGTLTVR
ncbi:hypothetical protein [Actinoallomurus soli]|uniref:hypothetical protein n=1 Tax=Actinoallomurus soli TaxID=2952535 RepID=UPI0020920AE1|nr:hypothetical protein [Actinoallomurus soli]MCO5972501.1 hypothetical protein [Actinoallomurus soli]